MTRSTIGQSQNLFVRSDDFSNASWVKDLTTNPTITGDQIANPIDGTANADLFTEGPGTGFHRVYQGTYTLLPGNFYTLSAFFKDSDARYAALSIDGTSELVVVADLQTGTITATSYSATFESLSTVIQDYGNGWYRVAATFLCKTKTIQFMAFAISGSNVVAGISHAGASKSLYIWRAQFVQANWAGAPLQTVAASVTTPIRNIVISRSAVTSRTAITSRSSIS